MSQCHVVACAESRQRQFHTRKSERRRGQEEGSNEKGKRMSRHERGEPGAEKWGGVGH